MFRSSGLSELRNFMFVREKTFNYGQLIEFEQLIHEKTF